TLPRSSIRSLAACVGRGCCARAQLAIANFGADLPHRVAEANRQHRLARVLENIDDLAGGVLEKDMASVGQQVVVRAGGDRLHQSLPEFALQEADDLAHLLQREAAAAQVADDRHFRYVVQRIEPAMPLPRGNHDAPLIPPLQLSGGYAGQRDYVTGS